jgi:hypothetical protein
LLSPQHSGSGILHGQLHGFFPLDSLDSFGMNTQIGQDSPMSLIDDWGENDPFPLDLGSITSEQLSSIAFLFGGVGDG